MQDDYHDAAKRHWNDANFLFTDKRWANADHLFGFAAECALKEIMLRLLEPLKSANMFLDRRYFIHIDKLWDEFCSFAEKRKGANYVAKMGRANPFQSWRAQQRYVHQINFDENTVEEHRQAAQRTMKLLDEQQLDGTAHE